MTAAAAMAAYALLVGAVAPYALARARWAHRAPGIAVLAWQGLSLTFVVATVLGVGHLACSGQGVHHGLLGLLGVCGPAGLAAVPFPATPAGAASLLAPATVALLPVGALVRTVRRARRERREHADLLRMIGSEAVEHGVTVVEHARAAVYCLPGRGGRIVATRGALTALTEEQFRAVLEHERAHMRGRHHLPRMAAQGFAAAFPWLPLARLAREQTALLLEMVADDRALRFHSRDALATAMCEVAAGSVPRPALGAGGPGALIRLRRILSPQGVPSRAARLGLVAASAAAPALPLLLACGSL
ncbi:M56 family metallopeptidase [Streptomyces jumonjinensis]|uniref:M56 family metallopeptidase n=1 Tax=Streptomyces jumonjinensis TaxID=1945 RepID=A0A646KT68_STRJU|nr:M56 family metallopeptidase [Streptomyces jumonjinensis]MQT05290.1 M56 family metallopeptidase [Streptomyces jumonjinensis]